MFEPGQQTQVSGGSYSGQGQSPQSQGGSERLTYGEQTINTGIALQFLEAFVDQTGESVNLIAACNWPGHSLADIAVNRRGKQMLGAAEEFTIVDPRAVPNPALTELRQRQVQIQQKRGYQQTVNQ